MALLRPSRTGRALLLAAAAPLLACSDPTAIETLSARLGPPYQGVITAVPSAPRYQWSVERASTGQRCDDVVLFSADDHRTVVSREDGTRASVADVVVGQRVSIWFTPLMLASCPGQTGAETIVLH